MNRMMLRIGCVHVGLYSSWRWGRTWFFKGTAHAVCILFIGTVVVVYENT